MNNIWSRSRNQNKKQLKDKKKNTWCCKCDDNGIIHDLTRNLYILENILSKKSIASQSFTHARLITGFVTRLAQQVPLVEQDLLTLPEHLSSPPVLSGDCVTRMLYICFCRSLFVLLNFLFWPLCCLFFFAIRILIGPLVSSNSSY